MSKREPRTAAGRDWLDKRLWWCGFYGTMHQTRWHGEEHSDDPACGQTSFLPANDAKDRILAIEAEARERAAQIAEYHAERLKHTSHRDGLGMGWLAGEDVCREIAKRIRDQEPVE